MPARKTARDYMSESGHRWVVATIPAGLDAVTAIAECSDCPITVVTTPAKVHAMMASKHRHPATVKS